MSKNPLGVDKGARPLMFIPALTTSASERMKTFGFRSLRPPLAAPKAQAEGEPSQKWTCHFCEINICYKFVIKNY